MKFVFVFPGQGSQSAGMMKGFAESDQVYDTFVEASAVLKHDLWALANEGTDEELGQTVNTQPVMLTAGIAVYRAWQALGGATPSFMAGHSLGEYTALVAAGSLSFSDALPLVRFRAQVMQEAVAEGRGAMAAILGLGDEVVQAVCAESAQGEVVEAVNYNSPGQVVIAGSKAAVERAMARAKERGAKRALPLPLSVPSHCALMKPAAEKLRTYLQSVALSTPEVPVLHNADVAAYDTPDQIKDALVRQLYSPVRWVETVRELANRGTQGVLECGPGKVLTGLNKRIVDSVQTAALIDTAALLSAKNIFN